MARIMEDRRRPHIPIPLTVEIGLEGMALIRKGASSEKDHFICILPDELYFLERAIKRMKEGKREWE